MVEPYALASGSCDRRDRPDGMNRDIVVVHAPVSLIANGAVGWGGDGHSRWLLQSRIEPES